MLRCNGPCMTCKVFILTTYLPKVSHMGGIAAACGEGFCCARGMQDGDDARLEGVLMSQMRQGRWWVATCHFCIMHSLCATGTFAAL